jgi:hypothetical protein
MLEYIANILTLIRVKSQERGYVRINVWEKTFGTEREISSALDELEKSGHIEVMRLDSRRMIVRPIEEKRTL